jgi:hypothetical protein
MLAATNTSAMALRTTTPGFIATASLCLLPKGQLWRAVCAWNWQKAVKRIG